jgi:hypothetical protein
MVSFTWSSTFIWIRLNWIINIYFASLIKTILLILIILLLKILFLLTLLPILIWRNIFLYIPRRSTNLFITIIFQIFIIFTQRNITLTMLQFRCWTTILILTLLNITTHPLWRIKFLIFQIQILQTIHQIIFWFLIYSTIPQILFLIPLSHINLMFSFTLKTII